MKIKITSFFYIVFFALFLFGCSKENKIQYDLVQESINREYIVGENIEIKELEIKVKDKVISIDENNFEISNIDNTIVGTQKLDVEVNYNGVRKIFNIDVTFNLPEEVNEIISSIDALPELEYLNFTYNSCLESIESMYSNLDDFYKLYVNNYNKYLESKVYINNMRSELITTEVANQIFIYKTNLVNYYNGLNENDYSSDNWNEVVTIYSEAIRKINLDEYYDKVEDIVKSAKNDISNIETISQTEFNNLQILKINNLTTYRNSFKEVDYNNVNWIKLNNILNNGIININSATNKEQINNYYNSCIELLDNVLTIAEEKQIELNHLRNSKIVELSQYYNTINLNIYSASNKYLIRNEYSNCHTIVNTSTNENEINNIVDIFINNIKNIKTIAEEYEIALNNEITNSIDNLIKFFNDIYMYDYDSSNRLLIENIVNQAIYDIENTTVLEEVKIIENNVYVQVDKIPTMIEQAANNLPVRIENAISRIEEYYNSLSSANYSENNWNNITSIINDKKTFLRDNITVSTTESMVNKMIDDIILELKNILTIEEEQVVLLEETKINSINYLKEYCNSIINDYSEERKMLINNRINSAIATINELNDIDAIIKLKNDTINAIENLDN